MLYMFGISEMFVFAVWVNITFTLRCCWSV